MDVVRVRHAERDWTVRACVLSSISPVLHGILEHSSDEERVLPMEGSVHAVAVFLSLAHLVSYDKIAATDAFDEPVYASDASILKFVDDDVLELIFKYEAFGVLQHVRTLLTHAPHADLTIRLCSRFPEDTAWCTPEVCACVQRHVETLPFDDISAIAPTLLARLLVGGRHTRINVFRPTVLDDRLTLARQTLDT